MNQETGYVEITKTDRLRLEALWDAGMERVHVEPEYWIAGSDEGLSYCRNCCEREVTRLRQEALTQEYCIRGGWDTEGDYTPTCEICGQILSNTFTDYACESEIEHFLEYGFDPDDGFDCLSMSKVIDARGWEPFPGEKTDLQYYADLHRLCEDIILGRGVPVQASK